MDSTDLAYFTAVVEEGSVTAAARRLNCVQSNVTARIRSLETRLGVRLFNRNGRGVLPTRAAETLLPHARQVAAALAAARSSLENLLNPDRPTGSLSIGSMETTAAVRLPPVLAAYHRTFPDVAISLRTGGTKLLIQELLAYQMDAALVAGPVDHPDLIAADIGQERMVVVTAVGKAWQPGPDPVTALCFRSTCAYRARLEGLLAALGTGQPRLLEFGTLEGIIGGVAAGIGISLLPLAAVERSPLAGALSTHSVPPPWDIAPTQLIYRRDAVMTAALARFIEHTKLGWA